MNLNALIKGIDILDIKGTLPQEVSGIYNNSKQVQPQGLFMCIVGYKVDGHDYLQSALENGASVAIVERAMAVEIPQIIVKDSRLAMAKVAHCFYGEPSQALYVVGITATNGKTSTAFMVDEIFKYAKKERGIIGTVKTEFKNFINPSILTTPESLTLQSYFSNMKDVGVSHVTMEVSSSGLELNRVAEVDFDVVTLNNISHEHIDQHGSFEKYVAHKVTLIKGAKPSAWAILNLDDTVSKSLISQTKANVLTYGYEDKTGDLVVKSLDLSTGMAKMEVALTKEIKTKFGTVKPTTYTFDLNVAGFNSVMNGLVALGVAIVSGISKEDIEQGLSHYKGVERRFQIVYDQEFKIVDDHFANKGNIDVTLKTLNLMDYNDIVFIYAIRGYRGVTTNRENAEQIVHWASILGIRHVYASLSRSHVTWKDAVTDDELAVFKDVLDKAKLSYTLYDELPEAIASGLDQVKDGDIVLLAGCQGMDCGAHVALKELYRRNPKLDKAVLYQPIIDRVCCDEEVL